MTELSSSQYATICKLNYLYSASSDVDVDQDVTNHYDDNGYSNANTNKEHIEGMVCSTIKHTEEEFLIIHMVTPAEEVGHLSKETYHLIS